MVRPRRNEEPQGRNLVEALVAALQGIANRAQAGPQPQNNEPAPPTTNQVIEQFRRYSPPKFDGRSSPLILEEWIMELERIFEHIECNDAHKVSCAVFQLTHDAGHWWQSFKIAMTEEERQNLTWERFKAVVMEKYFPRSYRNQKQAEFLELRQGDMKVIEYERRFNKLARYAARLVDTDEDRADRFLRGLKPEIRGILAGQEILSYGVALRRAHEVEVALEDDKNARSMNHRVKRKWNDDNGGRNDVPQKQGINDARPSHTMTTEKPICPQCKRQHFGKCFGQQGVCYICHDPGHYANNCPRRRRNEQNQGGKARLFAFSQQDADEGNGSMSGAITHSSPISFKQVSDPDSTR